ncbi:MAG: universal stress protein [Acidimicrobiales bacterium]
MADEPVDDEERPAADARRIVVGVDGSASSKSTLAWAARQATLTGASLEIVAAWGYPVYFGTTPVWPSDFDPQSITEQSIAQAVEELRGTHPGLEVRTRVEEADASIALLEAAEGADLLVVGSRGHGAFAGMLLGSVSQHCVTHAHCPVVVVRDRR